MTRATRLAPLSLLVAALPVPALAQTGAQLLLQPWETYGPERGNEAQVEFDTTAAWSSDIDVDDTDDDLDLWIVASEGRVKLTGEPGAGPAIGYEALHIDLNTDDAALPDRLSDTSVAAAFGHRLDDGWELGFVAGVGYAGTTPYSDGDSVYFLGDAVLAKELDDGARLTFALNYNGNRNVLPDVPLPGVTYARASEAFNLRYIVGFPYSQVVWNPADAWTVTAGYSLPFSFTALVEYELDEPLTLFASYGDFTRGFWLEDADDRRLFFTQQRVELGARYRAVDRVELVLAGGYAFGQEFEAGWDLRDTDTVRELDAAPYVRAAIDVAW